MSQRYRIGMPEKQKTGKLILGPVVLYAMVGALSRLFGRRKNAADSVEWVVWEVRREMGRGRETSGLEAPTPEQVRMRREERRRREAEEARR